MAHVVLSPSNYIAWCFGKFIVYATFGIVKLALYLLKGAIILSFKILSPIVRFLFNSSIKGIELAKREYGRRKSFKAVEEDAHLFGQSSIISHDPV